MLVGVVAVRTFKFYSQQILNYCSTYKTHAYYRNLVKIGIKKGRKEIIHNSTTTQHFGVVLSDPSATCILKMFFIIVDLQCCQFLLYCKVTQIYIYIFIYIYYFFHVILHHGPSQVIRYSSLCCTAGSDCLSTPNAIVCIYHPQTPSPFHLLCVYSCRCAGLRIINSAPTSLF